MKLIVADDHPMVRAGLTQILAGLDADVEVVEATDFTSAKAALAAHPDADLALLDLFMPGMNGATSVAALVAGAPTVPLVVVSANDTPRDIRDALAAGASGFVPKHENANVLLGALRLVLEGGTYAPTSLASASAAELAPPPALTPRQKDVLAMMIKGCPNKEIGSRLGLSEQTVKGHLQAIFRTLNVRNRVQAVQAAQNIGLVADMARSNGINGLV
jgi:two-component system, NarL family, nitrate/nitrite response regulator NarL